MKQVILFFALAGSAFGQYTIGMSTATNALGLQAATPTFSPVAGTYSSTQTVTISTTTPLAVLCYTTDGSTPTETANLCSGGTTSTYTTPITVSTTQTVKAIATLAGYTDSSVGSALYTISANIAYVTSSYATNTTLSAEAVTLSLNCAGGEFVPIFTFSGTGHAGISSSLTVSSGTAQTITAVGTISNNSSFGNAQFYYIASCAATSTTVLTYAETYTNTTNSIWLAEYTGLTSSALDYSGTPVWVTTAALTNACSTSASTTAGVLAVVGYAQISITGGTLTLSGTGYNQRSVTTSGIYGGLGDNLSTAGGSQSATWTLSSGARTSVCMQASFK